MCANAYISSSATKTVYEIGNYGEKAGTKVSWSDAESFNAYYDGGASPVIFSKTAAGTSFTAESVPDGVSVSTLFTGLYGSAATLNSEGKIDIDFSKQDGEVDNLSAYDVMTATSELKEGALSFAFKHNCAILRLKCVNHTANAANRVVLDFAKAQVSEDFGNAGFDSSSKFWIRLSINLETPAEKGSSEYGKGSVGYRYVMVPAMNYLASMPEGLGTGSSYDPFMTFHRRIDFYATKYIEAGKVYDVMCECGVEQGEDGGIWGD
ncbi:unknown [Bacteroides sp. CAG:709]|nr:unknown [Bacteroides sp. CAG:709]